MDASEDKLQILETKCEVCQKPALHGCAGCRRIYYCSKLHQKEHWKEHENSCKPFKVCDERLVATRLINPGDFILQESPLIWGPSFTTVPVCLGCGKVLAENSTPCSKCGWPMCGNVCEKSPSHLPECRYTAHRGQRVTIKNFGVPHPIYRCITILRCLYHKQFLPKSWKKLEKLESRWEEKSTIKYENERVTIAEFVRRFFKLIAVVSEEDIMKILGIVRINSHEVPPYVAIYGTAAMLGHDCSANCAKSFTKMGQIVITASKQIQEGDHLNICYTNPLMGTQNRRYFLHESRFFWCKCRRCEDPTEFGTFFSALKCQSTNCNGYLLPASFTDVQKLPHWVCGNCARSVSAYSAHDVLERIERDLCDLDKTNIEDCRSFLMSYSCYLHENHFLCTDVQYVLALLVGQSGLEVVLDEDLELKLHCCRSLENLVRILAPSEKRVLGVVLFQKHAALDEIGRRKGAGKTIDDLKESRTILLEVVELLKNESEGKIYDQAKHELEDIDELLERLQNKGDTSL